MSTNKLDGRVYVGQDIHNNPDYFGSGIYIYNAIKKYGKENFAKEVIDSAETKEILNEKERCWIKFYNCKFPNGYNLTDGGQGPSNPVEEIRRKMRKPKSEEHKEKLRKPRTEETKRKIKENHADFSGEKNPMFGKHPKCSDKTRENLSKAMKGKPKSEEHKQKMRKPRPEGTGEKISQAKKGKKRLDMLGENNPAKRPEVRSKISLAIRRTK